MALINNPNSWNGGSAVFNPAPITETYLKLAAHREAKNQALEQYQRKKMESIDRDGVRDNDIENFTKKIDDWNKHWQFSKDRIKKGDIRAQVENDKMYNDLLAFAKNSKLRAEKEKQAIPVGVSMKNEMGTYPDQFQQDLIANNLPLGAEGSKPIELMPYMMKPDRWDLEKGLKKYSQLERDERKTYGQTDPKTGMRPTKTEEYFNDKSKAQIAAIAGSDFHNDRSFNQEVRTAVTDPATKQHLAEVFEQNFGVKPDQPEHYATAFILAQKPLTKVKEGYEADKEWQDLQDQKRIIELEKMKQGQRIALEGMKQGNRKSLAKYRADLKGLRDEEQANVLDNTFETMKADAKKTGARRQFDYGKPGKLYYEANVPNIIKKDFAYKQGSDWVYPDKILFNEDGGQVDVVFYKKEGDEIKKVGGKNAIDTEKSHSIDENQLKAMIGKKLFGVKTTSGASYYGDEDDEDEDDDMGGGAPIVPSSGTKSNKKKIPGF